MPEFYKLREAKDGLPKSEALRERNWNTQRHIGGGIERLVTIGRSRTRKGSRETAKQPRFNGGSKKAFCASVLWRLYSIGNWQ